MSSPPADVDVSDALSCKKVSNIVRDLCIDGASGGGHGREVQRYENSPNLSNYAEQSNVTRRIGYGPSVTDLWRECEFHQLQAGSNAYRAEYLIERQLKN